MGNAASRRDDVIQILYTLVFLLNRFKPLDGLDHNDVIKFKTERPEADLCNGNDAIILEPLLKEVHQYQF
jgi:hypothetical protein